jgi:hypothetical protein
VFDAGYFYNYHDTRDAMFAERLLAVPNLIELLNMKAKNKLAEAVGADPDTDAAFCRAYEELRLSLRAAKPLLQASATI